MQRFYRNPQQTRNFPAGRCGHRPLRSSGQMPRVYLKTPNAPGQRTFSRCAAPFFLEIRQYSCEKMSCSAQKFLAAGHIGSFQIHPTQCSHEFALGFRFSQLPAARPLRHSAADAVQTGEVFFEVAGGREGEIEGHTVAFIGQAWLRQGFAEAADGQGG